MQSSTNQSARISIITGIILLKNDILVKRTPAYCEPILGRRVGIVRCPERLLNCFQNGRA